MLVSSFCIHVVMAMVTDEIISGNCKSNVCDVLCIFKQECVVCGLEGDLRLMKSHCVVWRCRIYWARAVIETENKVRIRLKQILKKVTI